MLQVGANLLFSVGVWQALEQRDTGKPLDDLEPGSGLFALLAGLHDFRATRHPADLGFDLKRLLPRSAMDEAVEHPLFLVCPEQVSDLLPGLVVFAEQGDATRLEVDAIGKTEVPNVTLGYPASLGGDGVLYQVGKTGTIGKCRTVRDSHVGHFVEREVMLVLEEDRE